MFFKIGVLKHFVSFTGKGSRTITPEENCPPPTLKLTLILIQTLTLTGGQFSSGAIVRIPLILYPKAQFLCNNGVLIQNNLFLIQKL